MRGTLLLQVKNKNGHIVATRKNGNAVMRSGGELIARLFAGQGAPITHMGVGTSDAREPDNFSTANLTNDTNDPDTALSGPTEVPLAAEVFQIIPDEVKRVIKVRVRGTLPDAAAVGVIREAGLLSIDGNDKTLYNRVTFAPVTKEDDHELTMFWEVSFPFGDLQWF